jgi:hypothetical protein
MLGEQIAELKGKVTNQRVLNQEGAMEATISFDGTLKGTPAKMYVTFVGRPTSKGVIQGEGRGVVMAGESEMATFTTHAFGRVSSSGGAKWRGAHFFRTSANGKLAFLNNFIGLFEGEIDAEGNDIARIWEWK